MSEKNRPNPNNPKPNVRIEPKPNSGDKGRLIPKPSVTPPSKK